jgi:hypothetical protein
MAHVVEVRDGNESRRIPVKASTAFTYIIGGLTITLSASVVAGNEFEIAYTSIIADSI